jgi:CreA protein
MKIATPAHLLATSLLLATPLFADADTIDCVTTACKLIGTNHRICVDVFHDPKMVRVSAGP